MYIALFNAGAPNSAKFKGGGGVTEVTKIEATTWVKF